MMRHHRRIGLFSLFLAGSMCVVTGEARAAGKRSSTRTTRTATKPADSTPADDSAPVSPKPASDSPPPRVCKKAEPVVSSCAPNKVLLPPAVSSPYTEGQIAGMVAADVNGDGKADLILSHSSRYVEVLLSKGDGTFAPGPKIEDTVGGDGLVVADFDGDCKPDVLVASFAGHSTPQSVNLYSGKGNGAFRVVGMTTDVSQDSVNLLAADFNADGKLDFVYTGTNGSSGVPTIVYNSGKGRLGPSGITHELGGGRYTAGDLTGDGAAEFVSTVEVQSVQKVCVRANNGNGQFDDPVCSPLSPSVRPLALAIVDLNGDGKNDVVVCSENMTMNGGSTFDVFLNKGEGALGERASYLTPNNPTAMTVADVNNDGKPDLVAFKAGEDSRISLLKNRGDGTFAKQVEEHPIGGPSGAPQEMLVHGDFRGNGLEGFAALDRGHNAVSVIAADCKP